MSELFETVEDLIADCKKGEDSDEVSDITDDNGTIITEELLEPLPFIPYDKHFIIPTIWVDQVGDSQSEIVGYVNLKITHQKEYDQADNMTASLTCFETIDKDKECAIAVNGQNGDGQSYTTIYREISKKIRG